MTLSEPQKLLPKFAESTWQSDAGTKLISLWRLRDALMIDIAGIRTIDDLDPTVFKLVDARATTVIPSTDQR